MNITLAQKMMLVKYGVKISDDAWETMYALLDRMVEIGFTSDFNLLNPTGVKMQKLYDELYEQNKYGDIES
mgnify:CR=1 FL=1